MNPSNAAFEIGQKLNEVVKTSVEIFETHADNLKLTAVEKEACIRAALVTQLTFSSQKYDWDMSDVSMCLLMNSFAGLGEVNHYVLGEALAMCIGSCVDSYLSTCESLGDSPLTEQGVMVAMLSGLSRCIDHHGWDEKKVADLLVSGHQQMRKSDNE